MNPPINRLLESCPICGSAERSLAFVYEAPPAGETIFSLPGEGQYHREIWQCSFCSHFMNVHRLALDSLYQQNYLDSTYGREGLLLTYERINALPPERSDNHHRVRCVNEFMATHVTHGERGSAARPTLLDVGAGLGVFASRMKDHGWDCTALDPDPRAVEHARNIVGVKAICGDFLSAEDLGSYNLVTFNKVLEHVLDPAAMLRHTERFLSAGGFIYVEVPDGEIAMGEGPGREEFFIEHWHVFSLTSLSLLAVKAGFVVRLIERVREPSTKFTLRAFLSTRQ